MNHILQAAVTPEEQKNVQRALLALLSRQTALYTDSCSLPKELAQALFSSLCFTLRLSDPAEPEEMRAFLMNPEGRLAEGRRQLEQQVALNGRLWQAACQTVPPVGNRALVDTLKSLGGFRRRYDLRFFAHEIPCEIDYPLCHPVPETLLGVEYVNEYLRRLCMEQAFLRCVPKEAVWRVLGAACPDYKGLLINLYEPVFTQALGLALLGQNPLPLAWGAEERTKLAQLLLPLSSADRRERLFQAAGRLVRLLGIAQGAPARYFRRTAAGLLPRLEAALQAGNLDYLFF